MKSFLLDIAFTNEQLKLLSADGYKLVLAKSGADSDTPDVAWLVFQPMEENMISWTDEYGVYASTSDLTEGARLVQLSYVAAPAAAGQTYTLQDSGALVGPADPAVTPGSYSIVNQYHTRPYMVLGLFQGAGIGADYIAKNAISASKVLQMGTAMITAPSFAVFIWLSSTPEDNSIIGSVNSPMTKLLFDESTLEIALAYDDATGKFVPAKATIAELVVSVGG